MAKSAGLKLTLFSANMPVRVFSPIAVFSSPVVLASSALASLAVLAWPVLLLKSANAPLAVFNVPVVLSVSAAAPVAVFWSPVFLYSVPAPTPRVELSGCYAHKREKANRRAPVAGSKV